MDRADSPPLARDHGSAISSSEPGVLKPAELPPGASESSPYQGNENVSLLVETLSKRSDTRSATVCSPGAMDFISKA